MVFTHQLTKELGAEFVYGITGDYLEKDDTGRVVALIGHNYKKEYFRFTGKNGIILAAGDFSGNREMVMDLLGEYAALTENGEKFPYIPAGRKGKGIQMGLWAGGKMEPGETPEAAIVREIEEELKVTIAPKTLVTTVECDYPKFHLTMHCFLSSIVKGEICLVEHEAAKWLSPDELDSVDWLPADVEVVEKLKTLL